MSDLSANILLLLTEAAKRERRAPKYGFSNGTDCARQAVYEFDEYEATGALRDVPTPLAWLYQMECGNAVGGALEAAARRLGWQTQVPVRWEAEGLLLEGTADIVGPDFVLDGKYVRSGTWRFVQKEAKWPHRVQTHGYAFCLDKPFVGVLYQRFTEKGEVVPFVGHPEPTDPTVAAQLLAHWREVDQHRKAKTLPLRPFGKDSFECKVCIYNQECWKGAV